MRKIMKLERNTMEWIQWRAIWETDICEYTETDYELLSQH